MTSAARHRADDGSGAAGALLVAGAALLDLVLPQSCGGCGQSGVGWCRACAGVLAAEPTRRVLPDGLVVWSATPYEDPVRSAIVRWKDRGRADLTRPLAVGLRRAVTAALSEAGSEALSEALSVPDGGVPDVRRPAVHGPAVVLVPVPSSRRSRRVRGHEPVRDLARASGSALRRQQARVLVRPVLRQARRVADQAGLAADARRRNLAGALAVRPSWAAGVAGRPVLLVDDVVTTGATLSEAARALREADAAVLGGATVAATVRLLPVAK